MSKQLYEEAIADLKKVKEIAEDNAKRAIIEAVAPRIKELIEKELLGESDVPDVEKDPKTGDKKPVITGEKKPEEEHEEEPEKNNESVSFINSLVSGKISTVADLNKRLLYVENALLKISGINETTVDGTIVKKIEESVDSIYDYLQNNVEDPNARLGYGLRLRKCLEKLENFQETKMKKNLLGEEKVTIELDLPGVDLSSMGDEEEPTVELVLDEEGEEEPEGSESEGEEEGSEPEGDEGEGDIFGDEGEEGSEPEDEEGDLLEMNDNTVVEIDEGMLRREIAFMKLLREADESEAHDVQAWGHGPGDVSSEEDFEADDLGDALELELSEAVADQEGPDADDGGAAANLNELEDDQMLEVDEDLLEMEPRDDEHDLGEVDHAKEEDDDLLELGVDESKPNTPAGQLNAQPGSSQGRDVVETTRSQMAKELKLQESLRNRAVQLKKLYEASKKASTVAKTLVERKQATTKVEQLKTAYSETAERYNRSVTKFNKLSNSLSEGAKSTRSNNVAKSDASADVDTLSKKLAETNLFNAKLLFTNKLLQTESLTARQKAQVIEQLDAAETIREAKLVYESLAKALVKPRKTVTEGRILGSSSQATRPASTQTLSEGVETERWAKLAGIVK